MMSRESKLNNKSKDYSTPIRVSNSNYEWLRKEAFINNVTIKQIADEIISEFKKKRKGMTFFL